MIITNVNIVLRDKIIEKGTIVIDGEKIKEIKTSIDKEGIDYKGAFVVPSFIDIHTHGGYGFDLMDKDTTKLQEYVKNLPSEGCGAVVQCTLTAPVDETVEVFKWYAEAKKTLEGGAIHLGIHHEGIFMSAAKKGAHNDEWFIKLDPKLVKQFQTAANNNIKIMTYAVERDVDGSFTKMLLKEGIVPSIGHTNATYDETIKGIGYGASSVTHLYNAMRSMTHREPSVLTAALESDKLHTEIIVDGVHVAKEMVNLAYRQKGDDLLMCITDSIRPKGLADGEYTSGSFKVIKKDKTIALENGTLAGGGATMFDCFRNIQAFTGCDEISAAKMCATNQANLLGISDSIGEIKKGLLANLVIYKADKILNTIVKGKIVYGN